MYLPPNLRNRSKSLFLFSSIRGKYYFKFHDYHSMPFSAILPSVCGTYNYTYCLAWHVSSIVCVSHSVVSDSLRPHRWQPTRLPRPWDSPGKNTGVGCHFLLQCMKVKSESEVAQLCPTRSNPMDCSLPGSSVHAIFQARLLEWGAIAFSESIW